uniref:HAD family hydrolase n=1 Tax=Desulfacinum infernum TaxID=35837 RepID=A0A831ZU34_9BACT
MVMDRWQDWLAAHVSRTPVSTAETASVPRLDPKPRVVLFDVYGTLLAARHGDLEAQGRSRLAEESFVETARFFGFSEESGRAWAKAFFQAVADEQERCRSLGIQRAEVLVERIWEELLQSVPDPPNPLPDPMDAAFYRELQANPVAPFEGAAEALAALRREGYLVGVASNAQFYTVPILEYALGGEGRFFPEAEAIGRADETGVLGTDVGAVFHPQWIFFSFQLGFAKPDPHFFRLVATRARRCGWRPEEVLLVGNDPVNDMEAARLHGIQAVLFTPSSTASSLRASWSGPQVHRFDALVQALIGR